ncbi:hypothetical protein [Escherichia coli]|uniref:hypothetical protein n=1 Tax=Escherichia coli TaxID=562 RepID=UPI00227F4BD8|nr:hypothetical protein [Escherichia coli]MCZ0440732.1 hypothetical protein [Escherichia coli]HCS5827918.1 hypothetical protein [Escherichia coli]
MKEKKTAALFVVTFIFIGYASRNTSWDKTEAHKALHLIARLCASLECDRFDDKKLAQEDKNHLALMLCYRSLIPSKWLIHSDWICCVLSHFVVCYLTTDTFNCMIFN